MDHSVLVGRRCVGSNEEVDHVIEKFHFQQTFVRRHRVGRGASRPDGRNPQLSPKAASRVSDEPQRPATKPGRLVVWYDNACPLCRREIYLMRRLDRRGAIDFVDVAAANSRDCPVSPDEMLARLHAREDGNLVHGAAAFAAMWRAIPVLRPLGLAARNGTVLALLEYVYCRFRRLRPRLQRFASLIADR